MSNYHPNGMVYPPIVNLWAIHMHGLVVLCLEQAGWERMIPWTHGESEILRQ